MRARIKALLVSTMLATASMFVVSPSGAPLGLVAQAEAAPSIGAKVGKPLKEGQDLSKKNKFAEALVKVKEADAVSGKTAYETLVVNDFLTFLNVKLRQYAAAAKSAETALGTGLVPAKDRPQRLKTLVQLNYQLKNYDKAIGFAEQYQRESGPDTSLQVLVMQAYYLQNNFAKASDSARKLVASSRAAGRKPDEDALKLWMASAFKQKDTASSREALKALVEHYPTRAYWNDLLNMTARDLARTDRMALEVYRLKFAAGALQEADDYVEMAQTAIQLGLPGLALSVMQDGFDKKVLGNGQNKGREQRLLNMARTQAEQDKASLSKSAGTPKARASLGEAYASYGRYKEAIALYGDAAREGKGSDGALAQLHLGQAQDALGNKAEARKAFASVRDKAVAPLAEAWRLLIK